ncbi:hypothetical protein BDV97DRAFT_203979 [Delphinella strobiligena]|nr:hypothetical protein BDV97DRAFT_203979 [Delphinella strobiligena]
MASINARIARLRRVRMLCSSFCFVGMVRLVGNGCFSDTICVSRRIASNADRALTAARKSPCRVEMPLVHPALPVCGNNHACHNFMNLPLHPITSSCQT